MSNPKNTLQEYCQKYKRALPIYKSRCSGEHHIPEWYCKIIIFDIEFDTEIHSMSKIASEKMVAQIVLDYLAERNIKPEKTIENKTNIIYLIDLDNIPLFNQKLDSNNIYIGFNNSLHHSIPKYTDWYTCSSINIDKEISDSKNNKLLYTIEGGVKDLIDHFMSMFTYPLSMYLQMNKSIQTVNIVSGDNSGFCSKICLEKALEWNGVKGIMIKNTRIV